MDIETFSIRERMSELREELIAAEKERLTGKKGHLADELDKMLGDAASEVNHDG